MLHKAQVKEADRATKVFEHDLGGSDEVVFVFVAHVEREDFWSVQVDHLLFLLLLLLLRRLFPVHALKHRMLPLRHTSRRKYNIRPLRYSSYP